MRALLKKKAGPLRLHYGCGKILKSGWLNIDLFDGDLHLDGRETMPWKSDSITMIYSHHFLEHLEIQDAVRFLKDRMVQYVYAQYQLSFQRRR